MIHTRADKEEEIQRFAYQIWKERKQKGDPDADNERQNWLHAKHFLYPQDMLFGELLEIA